MMILKNTPARSNKIRNSARGQDCKLQIVGICNHDPDTTVLAHLPNISKGGALKGHDFISCPACSACHDEIDGRTRHLTEIERKAYMYDALTSALNDFWQHQFIVLGK